MRSKDLESAHTPQPAVKPTSLALTLLRTPLRNVPNVTRARIEIDAVTRYWDKAIGISAYISRASDNWDISASETSG